MDETSCKICRNLCQYRPVNFDGYDIDCARCGQFEISGTAAALLKKYPEPTNYVDLSLERAKLSGWIRERNDLRDRPKIMSDDVDRIIALPQKSLLRRAESFLIKATRRTRILGAPIDIGDPEMIATVYGRNKDELNYIVRLLVDKNWIDLISSGDEIIITPDGYIHAEEIGHRFQPSQIGFVAMWFANEMQMTYEQGLAEGIRDAGYEPRRVDSVEHNNKIDDEIISQIRRSRFVVADFTGHRGGVYFEAGFALGLNFPVIWTCRENDLENIHFDTRQYAFIVWKTAEELRQRLAKRIEATIGHGPLSRL